MRLWGKVSLIFGPLILVAVLDVLSFCCPFTALPRTAPSWNINSALGRVVLVHLGPPLERETFMASPQYREIDEYAQLAIAKRFYLLYPDRDPVIKYGPGYYHFGSRVGSCSVTEIPYWPLLMLGLLPPLGAFGYLIAHAERYRRPKGLCQRCSYDLRGNATGICPECGTRWR